MRYLTKINPFIVSVYAFHESVNDEWCLENNVWQTENGFEHRF